MLALQFIFIDVVPDFYIALLPTFYWIVSVLASPFWGSFSDTFHLKKFVLFVTLIATATLLLLHYVFLNYLSIVILRIVTALFVSAYLPVSLALFTAGKSKEELGRRASLYNLSRSLGFFVSGYIASLTLLFFPSPFLFVVSSIFIYASAILVLLVKEEDNGIKLSLRENLNRALHIPGKGFIKNKNGHFVFLALALRHVGIMGMFSLLFVYLTRVGVEKYISSAISSFNTLFQIIAMYPFGYLADKFGRKKLYVTGFFLSSLVPITFMLSKDVVQFSLAFVFLGISFSMMISGLTPFFKDIAPHGKEGEALSFLSTGRGIGFIFGPLLAGLMVTYFDYTAMFITMTLVSLIGAAISMFGGETLY